MNRQNKRKQHEKGYYKSMPVTTALPARSVTDPSRQQARGAITATTALTVCAVFTWTSNLATANQTAAALWSR